MRSRIFALVLSITLLKGVTLGDKENLGAGVNVFKASPQRLSQLDGSLFCPVHPASCDLKKTTFTQSSLCLTKTNRWDSLRCANT